jgi:hypothetical protein
VNNLNILSEGLGGKHPIEVHTVSVTLPKPLSSDLWSGTSGGAMARGRPLTRRRRARGEYGAWRLEGHTRAPTESSIPLGFITTGLPGSRIGWALLKRSLPMAVPFTVVWDRSRRAAGGRS